MTNEFSSLDDELTRLILAGESDEEMEDPADGADLDEADDDAEFDDDDEEDEDESEDDVEEE